MSDASEGGKRTPIAPSSMTYQLRILPEQVLQPKQIGPDPIGLQDFEHAPPVDGVICLLEV